MFSKKLAGFVAVASLFATGSAFAAIAGSAHDFHDGAGQDAKFGTQDRTCIVCHTTHNGDMSLAVTDKVPLWDHEVTSATFTVYTPVNAGGTTPNQPSGVTKLCLSCHDGTLGLDSFGGTRNNSSNQITGTALVGQDLSDDHPVSVVYNGATVGLNSTPTAAETPLFGATPSVECASCHDVHNEGYTTASLLVMDPANSALCLSCHDK